MDCQMPVMDGYEAPAEIRRLERGTRRTPVIAMTANSTSGDREKCLEADMDDYISKPLRPQALTDILTRWVSSQTDAAPSQFWDPRITGQATSEPTTGSVLDEATIRELQETAGNLLADLLALYFEDAAASVGLIAAALGAGDAPCVARTAHKLKGGSLAVGAALVASIASELEARAQGGDLSDAARLLAKLEDALRESDTAFKAG
jgi:CheY-like chemotaxis protein